ncbi:putative MPP superfamily phosphohydrolase [Bacillus capparidis]|nr:putative MPP superfamily phosphohydrolase [Bacillus capparidis]
MIAMELLWAIALIIIAVSYFLYRKMFKLAKENRLIKNVFQIHKKDFTKQVNIFFISDIHQREISDEFINDIGKEKIDLVIIGGDLAEKNVPDSQIDDNLNKLSSLAKTLFVWGNNDYEVNQSFLFSVLKKYGITALRNESCIFKKEKQLINLVGIDDIKEGIPDYPKSIQGLDTNHFTLLISHNPKVHQQIEPNDGIDLILSGHTHGGQIRIGPIARYALGGTGKINSTDFLISNGYGTSKVPLRLSAPPEVHFIQCVPVYEKNDLWEEKQQ